MNDIKFKVQGEKEKDKRENNRLFIHAVHKSIAYNIILLLLMSSATYFSKHNNFPLTFKEKVCF